MGLKHSNALSHYHVLLSPKVLLGLQHLKSKLLDKEENFLLR